MPTDLKPQPRFAVYTKRDDFLAYRGRNQMRLDYLRLLAEQEQRQMEWQGRAAAAILLTAIFVIAITI